MSDIVIPCKNDVQIESLNSSLQLLLREGEFQAAIGEYESNSSNVNSPEDKSRLTQWLYGLALLLNGQEEDAQMTWMMAMVDGNETEVATWLMDLGTVLEEHATFQAQQGNQKNATRIRIHLREISPQDYGNLLQIIKLELLAGELTSENLLELEIIELLTAPDTKSAFCSYSDTLLEVLELYLNKIHPDEISVRFAKAVQPHVSEEKFVQIVYVGAVTIGHIQHIHHIAASLFELCSTVEPNNIEMLIQAVEMLLLVNSYPKATELGQRILANPASSINQVIGGYYILKSYLHEGQDWSAIFRCAATQESYLNQFIQQQATLSYQEARYIVASVHLLTYINDRPSTHRRLQNQVLSNVQSVIQAHWSELYARFQVGHRERLAQIPTDDRQEHDRPLRIGYICSCFYRHSVGWLARALMLHHDKKEFEIYIYGMNIPADSHPVRLFYPQIAHVYYNCSFDTGKIAEQIFQDQIDILVDLDSITRDSTCTVMAIKPAPIQATWLGWDAVGMNAIDYYIADKHSLPEVAQDYYIEKIWRLPNAFIGIDGFEVGLPTIRRSDLDIPEDATVFLNPQRGYKLSQEILQYQLQILKETPNSYLLLKGVSDHESLEKLVGELAKSIDVSLDRLRPLPAAETEETHRANLAIADVILDTFPYNGATTTTEALWMEIPIVTLVGQQFSARNSYALMRSAGITEGISWTPEEYIEWGIRMGTDAELRQQVSWKLRQGKRSAPLWNGKAFAQEMEAAYVQMYQNYVASIQDQAKA
jgi:predicted O-linked N-acetylglucosamine transferase (SPINDLY family)